MTRLSLSKANLLGESKKLDNYQRYLPSLDLKRKQLLAELGKVRKKRQQLEQALARTIDGIGGQIPMLADEEVQLNRLVTVREVSYTTENMLGTKIPQIKEIQFDYGAYGLLTKPQWVDKVRDSLVEALEISVRLDCQQERMDILHRAMSKATQRVNLVEKVLMPRARDNIKTIRIFLADDARAAVVRAKLAKNKTRPGIGR